MNCTFTQIEPQIIDLGHVERCMSAIPQSFHNHLLLRYEAKYQADRQDANLYLLEAKDKAENLKGCNASPDVLRNRAERLALEATRLLGGVVAENATAQNTANPSEVIEHLCSVNGIDEPTGDDVEAQSARIQDVAWWTRQLFKKSNRAFEVLAIHAGLVNKSRQCYVSDYTLSRVTAQRKRSIAFMEGMEAVNQDGETIDMSEVLQGSMANPAVRRAEMMVRIYGMEQYAKENNHVAEFYTITAPSKYHASSAKYEGFTPRDTQLYLRNVWAKCRTDFKRNDLAVYGIRVAEAHHDGCPHWHILLFMADGNQQAVRDVMSHHSLYVDGNELGAKKHRFTYEAIDPKKGSATGYVAKYIAKNVDGFGMDTDDESGTDAATGAERVRAWASVHGIRQFQFIGGASVGAWRELRRLREPVDDELIEQARLAADKGDWMQYLTVQGGALISTQSQNIKTLSEHFIDPETGELETNHYGELVKRVQGVAAASAEVITRSGRWVIQPKANPEDENVTGPEMLDSAADAFRFTPWSSVNNCFKASVNQEVVQ